MMKDVRLFAGAGSAHSGRYSIKNAGTDSYEIYIYAPIGGYGLTSNELVADISKIRGGRLDVRIHSPGGHAFEGMAMYEALKRHPAHITTHIDSLAASAASVVAMAGDEIVIAKRAQVMIHDGFVDDAAGNEAELVKLAATLGKMSNNIAAVYAEKAGGTVEAWRERMREETWYDAEEAVRAGLATRIREDVGNTDAYNSWNLAIFNYAGRSKAPAPKIEVGRQGTAAGASASAEFSYDLLQEVSK